VATTYSIAVQRTPGEAAVLKKSGYRKFVLAGQSFVAMRTSRCYVPKETEFSAHNTADSIGI